YCLFTLTATTVIYTLSLHDALPISQRSLPGTDNGLTFNYNKSKFSASANVNYTLTQLKVDLSSNGNGIDEDTDREDRGNRIGAYVNLNYKPSNKHDISGSFNYYNSVNENEYTVRLQTKLDTLG